MRIAPDYAPGMPTRRLTLGLLSVLALTAAACGSDSGSSQAAPTTVAPATTAAPVTTAAPEPCPVAPIPVVVSVDQWGDLVEQLGGTCTEVTTIIQGSSADPHDYEPTAADTAKFADARLVVVNGADYDHWAEDAAKALSPQPAIVNGGDVVGVEEGDNPHIWYGPDYVTQISRAVTTELSTLEPAAADYFAARAADWDTALEPYFAEIESLKASVGRHAVRLHRVGVRLHGRGHRPREPHPPGLAERRRQRVGSGPGRRRRVPAGAAGRLHGGARVQHPDRRAPYPSRSEASPPRPVCPSST